MKKIRIYNLCRKTKSWFKRKKNLKVQDLVSTVSVPSGDSFYSSALYLEFQSYWQSSDLELVVRKKKLVNVEVEQVKTMSSKRYPMQNLVYIGLFVSCRFKTLALRRNSHLLAVRRTSHHASSFINLANSLRSTLGLFFS